MGGCLIQIFLINIMVEVISMAEYRDIPGFPGYRAGDDGTIWSSKKTKKGEPENQWHLLKGTIGPKGYPEYKLSLDGKSYFRRAQCLVLLAFVGPPPPGLIARHYPVQEPGDCRLCNLMWDTRSQNELDKREKGTDNRGSRNGSSKLKEEDIPKIREMIDTGVPIARIAKTFNVSWTTISSIRDNKNWTHV